VHSSINEKSNSTLPYQSIKNKTVSIPINEKLHLAPRLQSVLFIFERKNRMHPLTDCQRKEKKNVQVMFNRYNG